MSKDDLHKGDKVEWQTHGTTTEGTVQEKINLRDRSRRPQGQGLERRPAVPRRK